MMGTQSGEKGYGGSEQVPVHDGVSLVLAGVISLGEFVVGPAWEVIGIPMTAGTVH